MRTVSFLAVLMMTMLLQSYGQAQECRDGKCSIRQAVANLVPAHSAPVEFTSYAPIDAVVTEQVSMPIQERKVIQYIRYSNPAKARPYRIARLFRCHR